MKKKQSLKKFFILIAIWALTIAAVFSGAVIYDQLQASEYDVLAQPYIKKVVPVLSQWDPVAARALMAPHISETIPEANFVQAMDWFSQLGALQSMAEPKFDKVHKDQNTEIGKKTIVVYDVEAKYEHGDAVINLKLMEIEGSFAIYRFDFGSELLLKERL